MNHYLLLLVGNHIAREMMDKALWAPNLSKVWTICMATVNISELQAAGQVQPPTHPPPQLLHLPVSPMAATLGCIFAELYSHWASSKAGSKRQACIF